VGVQWCTICPCTGWVKHASEYLGVCLQGNILIETHGTNDNDEANNNNNNKANNDDNKVDNKEVDHDDDDKANKDNKFAKLVGNGHCLQLSPLNQAPIM